MKEINQGNTPKTDWQAKSKPGYRVEPFSFKRKMVAASTAPSHDQNNINALIEVDITEPRQFIRQHRERTGEKLSLTAFVIACLAQAVREQPHVNAFRKGGKMILLDDVTISAMLERDIDGELVPEPIGIRAAQRKSYRQIHQEIRSAQQKTDAEFGGLEGMGWVNLIPGFLLKTFIRIASRSITMMSRYGAVAVTAVGMFGSKNEALWLIPLIAGATVAVTVGGIVERPRVRDGRLESREHLCLTVTFNHDIVDGAPAARFIKRFSELLQDPALLEQAAGSPDAR
jgi:pyruvate/2-oxoglutarate dehydrogenase complex dihydrolipoamide acyltransferase (E2) component